MKYKTDSQAADEARENNADTTGDAAFDRRIAERIVNEEFQGADIETLKDLFMASANSVEQTTRDAARISTCYLKMMETVNDFVHKAQACYDADTQRAAQEAIAMRKHCEGGLPGGEQGVEQENGPTGGTMSAEDAMKVQASMKTVKWGRQNA